MNTRKPITLVTGASSGIGAALARVFAENRHSLVLVARREAELSALADGIAAIGADRPEIIAMDLTASGASDALAAELETRGLEPAVVVNSAGFGLAGAAARLDLAQQLAMIDLNARMLTDLSLRFVESLGRHNGGVLNVGSIAGFYPGPVMAVYHATKAYVLSFGEALHHELRGKGVRVTTLCPGPVETAFMARAGTEIDAFPDYLRRSVDRVARDGYDGFMRGRRVVVPGSANRVTTWLPRLLPRRLVIRLIADSRKGWRD
jgi:short-subunit dehydrogenase